MDLQKLMLHCFVILFLLASCENEEIIEPEEMGFFSLSLKDAAASQIKNGESQLNQVTHALITITKGGDIYEDYNLKNIKISSWGNSTLATEQIQLLAGDDYKITRFELQNNGNQTIYASPLVGSKYAQFVNTPLEIRFKISMALTTNVEIEVVSSVETDPSDFGFAYFSVKITDTIESDMIFVKGGKYQLKTNMGNEDVYNVALSDFYISRYEVSQDQWHEIMGTKPLSFKGGKLPIVNVSWEIVMDFIDKLNIKTGTKFRLPTEAEWIYAARGGNKTKGFTFSGSNELKEIAWYKENSKEKIHPVGGKIANELGLFDMTGNVWEWCADKYETTDNYYFKQNNIENPYGKKGPIRVCRGGGYDNDEIGTFKIDEFEGFMWGGNNRNMTYASSLYGNLGFRLVINGK